MKNIYKIIVIGIFLFCLTGCVWWSKYTYAKVKSNIIRCQTNETEVRKIYGSPDTMGTQSGYMTLFWFYNILGLDINLDTLQKELVVFVNSKGVVVDYALNPHSEIVVVDKCSQ